MSYKTNLLMGTAIAASLFTASASFAGSHSDVCNTLTPIGDLGSFSGEVITIAGSITGGQDEEMLLNTISCFEKATGAKVEYSGSRDFAALIVADLRSNNAPNIAIFPQPGLAGDMAKEGHLVPLGDATASWMAENYGAGQSWVDLGTYADANGNKNMYGFAFKMDLKSLVWYSPEQFEDNGYDIPTTMEDLIALSDQMVADGNTPWCIGVESGNATGWTATDWMEDLMLRFQTAETYDAWVDNSMPFNDPKVLEVLEAAGSILKNEDYVGNVSAIATTSFSEGGFGVVDGSCAMHRQASFLGGILVGDAGATIVGPDATDVEGGISTFYFPGRSADDSPALGGGEFVGAFSDAPAVQAVQLYLTTPEWNNKKAALGGWFSPNLGLDTANVADPVNKVAVEILQNATTFRFDASDLMPGEVGAGSFWTEMTAWIAEDKADQAVLDAIQATWPAS